jgi:hypothetical protein
MYKNKKKPVKMSCGGKAHSKKKGGSMVIVIKKSKNK